MPSETDDVEIIPAAFTELDARVTPIEDLGFGWTFDAPDLDGHHLVVYNLSPEDR